MRHGSTMEGTGYQAMRFGRAGSQAGPSSSVTGRRVKLRSALRCARLGQHIGCTEESFGNQVLSVWRLC